MENGEGKSSQWAELWAVRLVISQEPSPIVVCTDSWAVYQGLTLWLLTWYHASWIVGHWPHFGGKSCGKTYGPLVRLRLLLYIM